MPLVSELTAGDTLNYTASVPGYPASEGWVLTLRLVPQGAGAALSVAATASGDEFLVQVAAGTTAGWPAGVYTYAAYVQDAGATVRHTVEVGKFTVRPDPVAAESGLDMRSHARRVLEAVEAVLEGRATQAHSEYVIGGRQLKFIPMADLLALRDKYRGEVWAEDDARSAAAGVGTRRKLLVRF